MRKIIQPRSKNLFEQHGQQNKDTQIFSYLQNIGFLCFSETGYKNIAARFGITVTQLKVKIKEYEAQEGRIHG